MSKTKSTPWFLVFENQKPFQETEGAFGFILIYILSDFIFFRYFFRSCLRFSFASYRFVIFYIYAKKEKC